MPERIFKNGGIMLKDTDSPKWGLEIYATPNYVAFVTHDRDGAVKPFPTINRREAKKLLRVLQAALED